MADGLTGPKVHADGVYLNLPLADYMADRAISGSALKKLMANAPDWQWEHASNPLWDEPESDARALGTVLHKIILEGHDAFAETFTVEPQRETLPDALDTAKDCSAWLREKGLKVSGVKDELVARIREADPSVRFWDEIVAELVGSRTIISASAYRYAHLVEKFVRSEPEFSKLLTDGLPEVSIFWTEDGVRFKARPDYLSADAIVELKKYGQPPTRQRSLMEHVLTETVKYGYDLQAVHNSIAVARLPSLDQQDVAPLGWRDARLVEIDESIRSKAGPPPFHWLFVHSPGSMTGIAPRWSRGTDHWNDVENMRRFAIGQFKLFREKCGDDLWIRSEGVVEIEDTDWPPWAGGQ